MMWLNRYIYIYIYSDVADNVAQQKYSDVIIYIYIGLPILLIFYCKINVFVADALRSTINFIVSFKAPFNIKVLVLM